MTDDDFDLWMREIKNVKPIKRESLDMQTVAKSSSKIRIIDSPKMLYSPIPSKNFYVRKYTTRFLKKINISAILDLHGFTVDKAISAFKNFALDHPGCWISVITGKSGGKLKNHVPEFIVQHPEIFIGYGRSEHLKGGTGVIYVHIRNFR